MAVKIAITGFGRIGRLILRAIYELNHQDIKVVAINSSRGDAASNAHLLKYDSVHGQFNGTVEVKEGKLYVNGLTDGWFDFMLEFENVIKENYEDLSVEEKDIADNLLFELKKSLDNR